VIDVDGEPASRSWPHSGRIRSSQVVGLLFLIGPVSDLLHASDPPAQVAGIVCALIAFVVLYLALLPPVHVLAGGGPRRIHAALAAFAVIAALPLALGAPRSFALLFVYVAAAAGALLAPLAAAIAIAVTAAAVAAGLAATGSDSSAVAAYALTIVAVGTVMAALASSGRANRALREAREELARAAVADERVRIARDLHDLLGHSLSVVALKTELASKLVASDPDRAQAELAEVQTVTRGALAEVREALQGYRRRSLAEELEGARSAIAAAGIECRVDSPQARLPAEVESVLAWAVREASTNVVRHSGARACAITLARDAGAVLLQVDDDGRRTRAGAGRGSGLAGLAERAQRLHGRLDAGARPEGGFRLRLTLPL
jgi:two-component system, NarL family, sensor histidine kinase DesK